MNLDFLSLPNIAWFSPGSFSNPSKKLSHHAVLLFWFASLIESETDSNFLLKSNQNSITPHWSAHGFHFSSLQWNLEWMSGHDQIKWAHQLVILDSEESLSLLRMGRTILKLLLLALCGKNLHQHHWILFGSKTLLEQLLCGNVITFHQQIYTWTRLQTLNHLFYIFPFFFSFNQRRCRFIHFLANTLYLLIKKIISIIDCLLDLNWRPRRSTTWCSTCWAHLIWHLL